MSAKYTHNEVQWHQKLKAYPYNRYFAWPGMKCPSICCTENN